MNKNLLKKDIDELNNFMLKRNNITIQKNTLTKYIENIVINNKTQDFIDYINNNDKLFFIKLYDLSHNYTMILRNKNLWLCLRQL